MALKTLKELGSLKGKKVLVRCDFNVPIQNGVVQDMFRIDKALPTITYLQEQGAKLILISHIEGESNTLRPVYEYLKTKISGISFCEDCLEDAAARDALKEGEALLCENLRLYDGEKENREVFGKELAGLADVYVNNAFSVSHRKHASIVRVPAFIPGAMGLLFEEEVTHLKECLKPEHPFLFILGGAKFDTKVPLIQTFLETADSVFVGGALAHNFFQAKGFSVGASLVSEGDFGETEMLANPKLLLPEDVLVKNGETTTTKLPSEVLEGDVILDAGVKTLENLKAAISNAHFILWNGPLGNYEHGFKQPTLALAHLIAESGAKTVVGGGDTLAAIAEEGIEDKFGFVSTAGGAMLDFLLEGTLVGIEALKKSPSLE